MGKHVATFKASGQSTNEWCDANNLKINQLRYWLRKLNSEDTTILKPSSWLSVEVADLRASIHDSSVSINIGKATIEVRPSFDPKLLSDVVRTLATLC